MQSYTIQQQADPRLVNAWADTTPKSTSRTGALGGSLSLKELR